MNTTLRTALKNALGDSPALLQSAKKLQGLRFAMRYGKYYGIPGYEKASTQEVNLEFSSACNLRCSFCALDHEAPKHYMSVEVLDRVLHDITTDKRFSNIQRINLFHGGETLMHPKRMDLFKRIAEVKWSLHVEGKNFPKVHLLTNGMLMREALISELLELQVLDSVGFSFDGGSPEAFEDLRVNAKWEKFYKNIQDFDRLRKEKESGVRMTGITIIPKPHPLNSSWMHPEFQEVVEIMDEVEFRRLHDWGGKVETGEETKVPSKVGCDLLMDQLVVFPTGNVTVCCNDLAGEGVIGNVLEDDLYSVYSSPLRREWMRKMVRGQKVQIELCKDCHTF